VKYFWRVSYFCGMTGRPKTTTESQSSRTSPVTFDSVADKQAAQAHAKRMGRPLAAHLKYLLIKDMEANPAPKEA
jgi:hypothetical protein